MRNLSHRYYTQWAIRDINFSLDKEGVYGLLGSNGAGKSTTMNIMCGVLSQTEGEVLINGVDNRKDAVNVKRHIGFLPQKPPLYLDLTVKEYLAYCAELRRVEPRRIKAAVERAMSMCDITHFASRLLKNLSGGYQQRVGIAQAIIHQPRLVVFDEPTNGLDPVQILEIRKLIKDIATERVVLMSTHILSEVKAVCENIIMIEHGRMVFNGSMEEFDNQVVPDSIVVRFGADVDSQDLQGLDSLTKTVKLGDNRFRLGYNDIDRLTDAVVARAVERGWHLKEIEPERQSLDVVFAKLSGKEIRQ